MKSLVKETIYYGNKFKQFCHPLSQFLLPEMYLFFSEVWSKILLLNKIIEKETVFLFRNFQALNEMKWQVFCTVVLHLSHHITLHQCT